MHSPTQIPALQAGGIILIAAYRENGQLKRIETPQISDMTAEFNYQDCDITVYVWDKDMKPLMDVQKIK